MKPRPNARLVSIRHAAQELGLAYHSLYRVVMSGAIKPVKLPGTRSLYLDRRDLNRAVEEWKS